MRRIKTITLSLLTLLLGVTAWAQVSQRAARAPKAAGDLTIVSTDPAPGVITGELAEINVTWSSDIGWIDESTYTVGNVVNAAGEEVAVVDSQWGPGGYDSVKLVLKPGISDPGTYTVIINENSFGEDLTGNGANKNVTNAQIELTYTIPGAGEVAGTRPQVVSWIPSVPVAELSTIEVTFDQPVELGRSATQTLFDVYGADFFNPATGAYASMKEGDDKTVVFTLQKKQTESATYELVITEGVIYPKGNVSDELGNEELSVNVDVAGEAAANAKFENVFPYGDTVEGETFGNINFEVSAGSKLDSSVNLFLVDENGQQWPLNVMDMISMMNTIILRTDEVNISGTYTLNIPAGFVTDKNGAKSEAFSKTWTYTNPFEGQGDDDRKLEIEYALLINNETGEQLDLMNPNTVVPVLGEGWSIRVCPNVFDAAAEVNVAFTHEGIDEYGNEGTVIDKRIEMWEGYGDCKKAEYFETELMGNTKLEEGIIYTVEFDCEDSHIAPELRKDWGTVTTTIKGGSAAYKYSPAELISVFPADGAEIFNPNQVFRLEFSQPVDVKVDFIVGSGVTTPLYTPMPANEERTVWTFTLSPSIVESETAYLGVRVAAKDDDGLVVKGNNSIEDKSVFALSWDCHLGCPRVTITPESGTLESIYSFTAVADDGGAISLGSALDKPYLTTTSGARVAEVDMTSEVKYDANGNVMTDEGIDDTLSVKVSFNLDKEVVAPGKYILVVPFGAFSLGTQFTGSSNRPMNIEYLIDGTPEYDRVSVADGASMSELSYVVVYVNSAVSLAERARMVLRDEEGVLANAELITADNNGVTMLIADFNQDGKPYQLEAGKDYTLQINANSVFLEGSDIAFPALRVNITGASAAAVSLTQEIAGLSTTVSDVVKGAAANVTLAPAEGWKVGKVLFNDADVTADVKNNVYTTPALDADATVKAEYEFDGIVFEGGSKVESVTDFSLNVYSENSDIVVAGLKDGMIVNVFTINGAAMGTYTVSGGNDILNVSVPAGIYVVTITFEGKTQAVKIQND